MRNARGVSKKMPGNDRQTLLTLLHLRGQVEAGIDQMTQLVVDVKGEDPQTHADLRGRQASARGVHHRVGQVFDQLTQLLVEVNDLDGGTAQHRVTEDPDVLDRHEWFLAVGCAGRDQSMRAPGAGHAQPDPHGGDRYW